MVTYSKSEPKIIHLRGKLLYPSNIEQVEVVQPDNKIELHYKYDLIEISNEGQQIEDYELFSKQNYQAIRNYYYGDTDKQLEKIYKGTWNLYRSEIDAKFVPDDIDQQRTLIYNKVEADLHKYIFSKYPIESQTSIVGYAIKALRYNNSKVMDACEEIQNWCSSCVAYFRIVITQTYTQDPLSVSWNFDENCPVPETLKTLTEIEKLWEPVVVK